MGKTQRKNLSQYKNLGQKLEYRIVMPEAKVMVYAGACKGEKLGTYVRYMPNAKIYCIEPVEENLERLRINLEQIKVKDPNAINVEIVKAAVWVAAGKKELRIYKSSFQHSFYEKLNRIKDYRETREVDTIDFAEYLKQFESVDYLRMDIEGAEYPVLIRCFEQGVMDRVKYLNIELHAHKIPLVKGLDAKLNNYLISWGGLEGDRWETQK